MEEHYNTATVYPVSCSPVVPDGNLRPLAMAGLGVYGGQMTHDVLSLLWVVE